MKIAHLIFSLKTGGAENMLVDIINKQVLYVKVVIYILNNEVNTDLLKRISKEVHIYRINRKPGDKNPLPLMYLNLLLLINKHNVVHCHNHNMIGVLFPIFHKKTILTIHDTGIESSYFHKYNECFSISNAVSNDVFSRKNIVSKVIPNGIALNTIDTPIISLSHNLDFHILQISRLDHLKKGQDIAIEAMAILKKRGVINIHLDFIGEGSSEMYLKELSRKLKVNDYITFLGIQSRSLIYKNIRNYQLLIQPSFYEGFGLTVIEAMAAKVPVLVSNIEGPMEIINRGEYGYHFEKGNAEELANKIIEIEKSDSTQIEIITEKAFHHVFNNYNIRSTALKYLREYQKYA